MSVINRHNIIVVKKGTTVLAKDESIYVDRGDGEPRLNFKEGTFVAYDPKRNIALDDTNIDDYEEVVMGVGWKTDPMTGYALEVRKLFNETTNRCDLVNGTAEPFKCGTAAVTDLLFRDIKADSNYTINIEVEDWESESFRPLYHPTKKVYSANTHVPSCYPECNPTYECGDLLDSLLDQINGVTVTEPMDGAIARVSPERYQPFFATKLFANSTQFCLSAVDSTCDKCVHVPAITGIKVGGTSTVFTGTTDPDDSTKTLKSQLNLVKIQADAALVDGVGKSIGTLTYTGGAGQCCDTQIEINTSETLIELHTTASAPFAECGTSNPIEVGYDCGLRVTAKHINFECMCDLPAGTYIKNKYRKMNINAVGEGWAYNSVKVNRVQLSKAPRNWGYDLKEIAYKAQTGGAGRGQLPYNDPRGRFNFPSEESRARNLGGIDCDLGYCTIQLESRAKFNGAFETFSNGIPGCSTIALEMGDSTNILAIQKIVNSFIGPASCPIFKTLECVNPDGETITPDTDAIGEGGVDTTHGFIASEDPTT